MNQKIKRILLVDDNVEIHADFRKILVDTISEKEDEDEAILLGHSLNNTLKNLNGYQIDSAFQGKDALLLVQNSVLKEEPYALAFIDMKMPPGWDGIETIKRIYVDIAHFSTYTFNKSIYLNLK